MVEPTLNPHDGWEEFDATVEDEDAFSIVPEGTWPAVILAVEPDVVGEKDTPAFFVSFLVLIDEQHGLTAEFRHTFWASKAPFNFNVMRSLCRATGYLPKAGMFDHNLLSLRPLIVDVVHEEYNDKNYARVNITGGMPDYGMRAIEGTHRDAFLDMINPIIKDIYGDSKSVVPGEDDTPF